MDRSDLSPLADCQAELERLQLEVHALQTQVDTMAGVGSELRAVRQSRSYRLAVNLQRAARPITKRMGRAS